MTSLHTETAGGIVVNAEGDILVVNQKGVSWSFPKGHIERGEDILSAALREIEEESGISKLSLICPLGSYERYRIAQDGGDDVRERKTIHMFLFSTSEKDLVPQDPENPEARWVSREKVADLLTHRKDKEFFLHVLSQKIF